MATNLDSVFFATQAAVPAMQGKGGGHIIQVSTSLVEHALQAPAVLASKGRLRGRYARPGDGPPRAGRRAQPGLTSVRLGSASPRATPWWQRAERYSHVPLAPVAVRTGSKVRPPVQAARQQKETTA